MGNDGRLFGEFSMYRRCPECDHGVPVNGPHDDVACDYCGAAVHVRPNVDAALERFWVDEYGARTEGRSYTVGRDGMLAIGGWVEYVEARPACGECGSPLTLVEPGTDSKVVCKACGATHETFAPPPELKAAHPYLLQLYCADRPAPAGEDGSDGPSGAGARASEVILQCPNCGAPLTATASTPRATVCGSCNTHLFLPDAVWEHLHVVRTRRRWYAEMTPGRGSSAAAGDGRGEALVFVDTDRAAFEAQRAWLVSLGAGKPRGEGIFGRFRLSTTCTSCGNAVPVNGPVRYAACGHCFATLDVERRAGGWIRDFEFSPCSLPDKERRCQFGGGSSPGKGVYQKSVPVCPSCSTPLPRVETGTDGDVTCPGCGTRHPTFPAPRWLREHSLAAAQCYLCDREVYPLAREVSSLPCAAASVPIAWPCTGCGAMLELGGGTDRVIECQYCSRAVHIPDAVWIRIHPPRAETDWWVEFGGPLVVDQAKAKAVAERAEEGAIAEASKARSELEIGKTRPRFVQSMSFKIRLAVLAGALAALAALLWYLLS